MKVVKIQSFGLGQKIEQSSPEDLGGKGAGLVWMDSLGVSVPPGFVIPTHVWQEYVKDSHVTMSLISNLIDPWLEKLKQHFGYMPLLSVRSGARVSCPGMMDTILNVGLDQTTEAQWVQRLGEVCVNDCKARLREMYNKVVVGEANPEKFKPVPASSKQVLDCIEAVFKSWNNDRAKFYRKQNNIPDEWGTACVIQAMVFGNLNDKSGTGVLFTRNPDTGAGKIKGDFLVNAQGEDVVDGSHTPGDLHEGRWFVDPVTKKEHYVQSMSEWNDEVYTELQKVALKLEAARQDVQDIEFTVQDSKLYILQTRTAKRSPKAAVTIAMDMFDEGLIDGATMAKRVSGRELDLAVQVEVDPLFKDKPLATGLPVCSGVAVGRPVFTAAEAVKAKDPVILVTDETHPDDIEGMHAARGVLTMKGGGTCHAAVVALSMNKPCVVGLGRDTKDFAGVKQISICGSTGKVWVGEVPVLKGDQQLVDKYRAAVLKAREVLPITNGRPVKAEAVWFVVGAQGLDIDRCMSVIREISKAAKTVYLDLDSVSPAEERFIAQVGGVDKKAFLKYLETHKEIFVGEVVVVGWTAKGFKTVGKTSDLESLIMATGLVVMEGGMTQAVKKVLEWKAPEGLKTVALGEKVYGSVSFMSVEQLLA